MPAKDIKGFEGLYRVDEVGNVFSFKYAKNPEGKLLKSNLNTKGYPSVRIYDNEKKGWTYPIHRLVAETHLPPEAGKDQVDHIDSNKANNHLSNLRWVTNQVNTEKENAKIHHLLHKDGTGVFVFNLRKWCESQGFDQATFYKMKSKQRKSAYGYVEIEVYHPSQRSI